MISTQTVRLSFEDPTEFRAPKAFNAEVVVDQSGGLRVPVLTITYSATPPSAMMRHEVRGYMDSMPIDRGSQLLGSCEDIVGDRWVFMSREVPGCSWR